ncbi:MAG: hypothetical protein IJS28_11405 [Synergistaceae bacterium]|nr:hypothetical protein [Synergistaceae bacterium]
MHGRSLRYLLVLVLIALIITPSYAAKARKKRASSPKAPAAAPVQVSITSLQGRWTGEGSGTGTDPRQPGVSLSLTAENIVLEIDNIKFSETNGEGMADVIFMGRILDINNNVRHLRSWEYSIPYDMKKEGVSSWSFSTEYLDGEDKITLTLTSPTKGILRWEGANWDDDFPEERDTFDITCSVQKK